MRGKNLVRRRCCKDVFIVSELFFKVWEGERNKERGSKGLKMGTREEWETVRTPSWQRGHEGGDKMKRLSR